MRVDEINTRFPELIQSFLDSLDPNSIDIRKTVVARNLSEGFIRLHKRYIVAKDFEKELTSFNTSRPYSQRSLEEIQFDYLDSVELYYMYQYVCISKLAAFLNHFSSAQIPTRSNTSFLDYIKKTLSPPLSVLKVLSEIEIAKDFRSRLLDHPQQYVAHDWMTALHQSENRLEVAVIYFVRESWDVFLPQIANQSDLTREELLERLAKCNRTSEIFISPELRLSMKAMIKLAEFIVEILRKDLTSLPTSQSNYTLKHHKKAILSPSQPSPRSHSPNN